MQSRSWVGRGFRPAESEMSNSVTPPPTKTSRSTISGSVSVTFCNRISILSITRGLFYFFRNNSGSKTSFPCPTLAYHIHQGEHRIKVFILLSFHYVGNGFEYQPAPHSSDLAM